MTLSVTMSNLGCGWGERHEILVRHETVDIFGNSKVFPIHGQTGFGKTTLLNVLSAFMAPQTGTVTWRIGERTIQWGADQPLDAVSRRHLPFGIARQANDLPANFRLHETLTGLLRHHGFSSKATPEMIEAAIGPFIVPDSKENVSELASKFPHEFSGGQRQRMALACALVHHPSVLFLDEPTASLNDKMSDIVLKALGEWLEEGTEQEPRGLVFVTHDWNAPEKMLAYQAASKAETSVSGSWIVVPSTDEEKDAARILERYSSFGTPREET